MTTTWGPYPVLPTIGGTGHRPARPDDPHPPPDRLTSDELDWLRRELTTLVRLWRDHCGTTAARSGLALGVDTVWAQVALDAGLRLHADCPGPWQANTWPADDQARWRDLRAAAGPRLHDYGDAHYDVRAYDMRNRGLIVGSDAFFTCLRPDVRGGGTWRCTQMLRRLRPDMLVWRFDPSTYTIADPPPRLF